MVSSAEAVPPSIPALKTFLFGREVQAALAGALWRLGPKDCIEDLLQDVNEVLLKNLDPVSGKLRHADRQHARRFAYQTARRCALSCHRRYRGRLVLLGDDDDGGDPIDRIVTATSDPLRDLLAKEGRGQLLETIAELQRCRRQIAMMVILNEEEPKSVSEATGASTIMVKASLSIARKRCYSKIFPGCRRGALGLKKKARPSRAEGDRQ